MDHELELFIGAYGAGALLEVLVVGFDSDDPRVIHAMPLRTKFHRYL